jgi:DNA-binding LytR/AlgR family response regulator
VKIDKILKKGLLKLHRSFIISIDKIESYMGGSVKIAGKNIPIGRNYKEAFRSIINDKSIE